jgi:CSLREA domain-containing protein
LELQHCGERWGRQFCREAIDARDKEKAVNAAEAHRHSDRRLSIRSLPILVIAILIGLALGLILVSGSGATDPRGVVRMRTIGVTTTEDELNSDGDCSLREAIQAANTDSAVDACAAGSIMTNYVFTSNTAGWHGGGAGSTFMVDETATVVAATPAAATRGRRPRPWPGGVITWRSCVSFDVDWVLVHQIRQGSGSQESRTPCGEPFL